MSFKALICTVYHMQSLLLPSFISVQVVCVKIFQLLMGISYFGILFILLKNLTRKPFCFTVRSILSWTIRFKCMVSNLSGQVNLFYG